MNICIEEKWNDINSKSNKISKYSLNKEIHYLQKTVIQGYRKNIVYGCNISL